MKTIELRASKTATSWPPTIKPENLRLAENEGKKVNFRRVESKGQSSADDLIADIGAEIRFQNLFIGETSWAPVLALGFCAKLGYVPTVSIIPELDEPVDEIMTSGFKDLMADGADEMTAAIKAHGRDRIERWAKITHSTLGNMFKTMADDQTAVAFCHSLIVEVLTIVYGGESLQGQCLRLRLMEGLKFTCDDAEEIRVTGKISVTADAAAK